MMGEMRGQVQGDLYTAITQMRTEWSQSAHFKSLDVERSTAGAAAAGPTPSESASATSPTPGHPTGNFTCGSEPDSSIGVARSHECRGDQQRRGGLP
eukprot:6064470-Amphidinium_carterae.1